ncbi:hypothetical protein BP6252_06628 [Coleophoma cylindrospora]|uniref:Zn(2)-C6 fungal-type domain-containing protein n=1 Tax=Coleophoma cylindrospora TaxID=1849047 RepID=A0A3D8RNF8_9HELO|nr:hypothetical protein BP6252_06628 [Coleophoma cylindrospora]
MSQLPPATTSSTPPEPGAPALKIKPRSCVVCRTRKVRCDKLSPCSNCRRGNIACVFPSTDRPPRWARRLDRAATSELAAHTPDQVMERLRALEGLVKDLSGQLEQANALAAGSAMGSSSGVNSPEAPAGSSHDGDADRSQHAASLKPSTTTASSLQKPFGRLVLHDANRSRYVSSGFWSQVNDELDGLGSDSSDAEEEEASSGKSPSTQELHRAPSERYSFMFPRALNASAPDPRDLHPLPSQIPFLLDVYAENVNSIIQVVHMPTVTKMVRDLRNRDMASLSPANEALLFSIYYAAITSMEEDDIMTNFGLTKMELNLRYRVGLEQALARADFLNVPDLVLVQAFTIFLSLVRRHDSPRFVWMMVGLVIRMGQALGLHRDGSHFEHLTPYEIEMRRRAWWVLCMLDVRASEDQGTEYTISLRGFDTKLPLNINEADISPTTTQMPTAREGITDMTFAIVSSQIGEVAKKMMVQGAKEDAPSMEEQSHLLNEMYHKLERGYLQYTLDTSNIMYWVSITITRLMMAKMTLLIYLPVLFSAPSEHFSDTNKTKLLVAAIENAEYNHALNAEQRCRHWRWVYQTYTHWHAVVYILIEICRRPWSPIVERAWVALHSPWLIPTQSHMNKDLRVWVPLRRLMAKARRYRDAELERLSMDPTAADQLEIEDLKFPVPASPGPFPAGSDVVGLFRERWRQLLVVPEAAGHHTRIPTKSEPDMTSPSAHLPYITQSGTSTVSTYNASGPDTASDPAYLGVSERQPNNNQPSTNSPDRQTTMTTNMPNDFTMGETSGGAYNSVSAAAPTSLMDPGFGSWLWPDTDPSVDVFANLDVEATDVNMDLDDEVDWYNWVESTKGMTWDPILNYNQRG